MQSPMDLLRDNKDGPVELPEEATATLNAVKDTLAAATLLARLDSAGSPITSTDASGRAIRGVLHQWSASQ